MSRQMAQNAVCHPHGWKVSPTPLPNHLAPRTSLLPGGSPMRGGLRHEWGCFWSCQPACNFSCLVPRVVPRAQTAPVLLDQGSRCPCTRRSGSSKRFCCFDAKRGERGGGAQRVHAYRVRSLPVFRQPRNFGCLQVERRT